MIGESVKAVDRNIIISICRNNDISMVGIFGSTARGEATGSSDVDLMVRFSKISW